MFVSVVNVTRFRVRPYGRRSDICHRWHLLIFSSQNTHKNQEKCVKRKECVQPGGKEKQLLRVLTVFSGFLSKSNDRLVFVHTF